MADVQQHYKDLLAAHYTWMQGGKDAYDAYKQFFHEYGLTPKGSGAAVDYGAGSGFQAVALAELGFNVTAVDTSQELLDELTAYAQELNVNAVCGDMRNVGEVSYSAVELAVCMGDTLTHLDSMSSVSKFIADVCRTIEPGGAFILSFRDMTSELNGLDRFIPVRSDDSTIFTCFLEYQPERVLVNDIIYTRVGDTWTMNKSSYYKLRIPVDSVLDELSQCGMHIDRVGELRRQTLIIAKK